MMYKNFNDLIEKIKQFALISENKVQSITSTNVENKLLDELAYNLSLNSDEQIRKMIFTFLKKLAKKKGIFCSSIHPLYMARGRGECKGFTVPAINLRGFTYYAAQVLLREIVKKNVGAFIMEIARSEIGYTDQRPMEYVGVILAAAIKESFKGPIFFQGDHFQIKLKKYKEDPEKEVSAVKDITKEAIQAGFYNIDVDTSTLVDLTKDTVLEQQRPNFEMAAELTKYIREIEPEDITVSVGAEIGEIGGKNSTPEELRTFVDNYKKTLASYGENLVGISKIAVQTGTAHGGVVLPDGRIADVKVDFDTIEKLSKIAREEYGLAGVVQHGASTLPDELFSKFPEVETAEIHLATGFQNIIFDNGYFPEDLKQRIYQWIRENLQSERKPDWTDEQFIYKLRKKAWGHFKKEVWDLPDEIKEKISQDLEKKFAFLLEALKVENTKDLVKKYISNNG